MYIYAYNITPRLQYVVNTLFPGMEVVLTASLTDFHEYNGPKIGYAKKRFGDAALWIHPYSLLSETGIKKQPVVCSEWESDKIFFQTGGDIPFDIFSAVFYLLSRYEEYLPHKKDTYGRYAHEESLAFRENFLHLPLVNSWKQKLFTLLTQQFENFKPAPSTFSFTPTYDIDIPYAHKGRGLLRKLIGRFKGEKVLPGGRDVFDVYDWLDDLHSAHQLTPLYFFLLANRRSKYDKNLSPKSVVLQSLISKLSGVYDIGIHPSWQSFHDEAELEREINRLARFISKPVIASRQHYIQLTLPYSYRRLIEAGITDDHSMGYGSINGFRASVATPFYWYDLVNEQKTSLLIHPFCYMDANSFFEQKFSAEEAAKELQHYHDVVKRAGGNLITIFHNHFLTEQPQWQPWRDMYRDFLGKNFSQPAKSTFPSLRG